MLSQTETISCLGWLKPASQIWPKRTLVRSLIKFKCQYKRRLPLSTIIAENIQRCFMQSLWQTFDNFYTLSTSLIPNSLANNLQTKFGQAHGIFQAWNICYTLEIFIHFLSSNENDPNWQLFVLHFFFSLKSILSSNSRLLAVWSSLKPNFPHDMSLCKIDMIK